MEEERRDRPAWETWAWRGLLLWNLLAAAYLFLRTPSVDATIVFRVTLYLDIGSVLWNLGRVGQIGWGRWQERRQRVVEEAATATDGGDTQAEALPIDLSTGNQE